MLKRLQKAVKWDKKHEYISAITGFGLFEDYLARILIVEREAKASQQDSEYISADQPRHRKLLLQSRGEPYIFMSEKCDRSGLLSDLHCARLVLELSVCRQ